MFIKKKNYKLLDKSIEDLSSTLEKANIKEIAYILGNKKEIIKIKNFSRMAHWNFLVRVMNQHIQMLSVILFPGTGMKNLKSFTSSKAV